MVEILAVGKETLTHSMADGDGEIIMDITTILHLTLLY